MNDEQRMGAGDLSGSLAPAVGYLREYRSMTCRQLAEAKEQLAAFAGQHGFHLRRVFVEQLHSDPAAFEALIKLVKRRRIPAVLVPNPAHLSAVGGGDTKAQQLRRQTGAHILVAHGSHHASS
jgi:hypothetical protein